MRVRGEAGRWRLGAALVIGGLVGPYTSFSRPTTLDVAISASAVALPVLLSVALDRTIVQRASGIVLVLLAVVVVGGLVLAGVVFRDIWQGYAADAGFFSLLVVALLAPVAVGFALGVRDRDVSWRRFAIACGAFAWLGVGVHNIVIPYYAPLTEATAALVQAHSQAQRERAAFSVALTALIILLFGSFYLMGLGIAVLGGWGGGALRARLGRVRVAVA